MADGQQIPDFDSNRRYSGTLTAVLVAKGKSKQRSTNGRDSSNEGKKLICVRCYVGEEPHKSDGCPQRAYSAATLAINPPDYSPLCWWS